MGRSPCCSKEGLNRGAWTALEDKALIDYIKVHGEGRWRNLPKKAGLKRCGKSCRLRWLNYLRPDIKRGNITHDEEELIIRLHKLLGNRWSLIAGRLPGRTDNEIKNYWNTNLGKKVQEQQNSASSTRNQKQSNEKDKKIAIADLSTDPTRKSETSIVRPKAMQITSKVVPDPRPQKFEEHPVTGKAAGLSVLQNVPAHQPTESSPQDGLSSLDNQMGQGLGELCSTDLLNSDLSDFTLDWDIPLDFRSFSTFLEPEGDWL